MQHTGSKQIMRVIAGVNLDLADWRAPTSCDPGSFGVSNSLFTDLYSCVLRHECENGNLGDRKQTSQATQ